MVVVTRRVLPEICHSGRSRLAQGSARSPLGSLLCGRDPALREVIKPVTIKICCPERA